MWILFVLVILVSFLLFLWYNKRKPIKKGANTVEKTQKFQKRTFVHALGLPVPRGATITVCYNDEQIKLQTPSEERTINAEDITVLEPCPGQELEAFTSKIDGFPSLSCLDIAPYEVYMVIAYRLDGKSNYILLRNIKAEADNGFFKVENPTETQRRLYDRAKHRPQLELNFVLSHNNRMACFLDKEFYITDDTYIPMLAYKSNSYINAVAISDDGGTAVFQTANNNTPNDDESGAFIIIDINKKTIISKGKIAEPWKNMTHLFIDSRKEVLYIYFGNDRVCYNYYFEKA